ncbi:MAG: dihydrolipoyl dehydrogenase [Parachlamydiales bacterium]|jgi:dihydrolipoamide dehydrogenase
MVFDLAVIGGGIGGYFAAIRAAEEGLKVVLIEKEKKLGGTCLNRGCIPTKMLLKKALFFREAWDKGLTGELNLEQLIEEKDSALQKIAASLEKLVQSHRIEILFEKAEFASKNQLLCSGKTIEAKKILLATGSKPLPLETLPCDHENIFNSNSILNLKTKPKSLAIIGGGYIGAEFASFFNALGVEVFLIEAKASLLSAMDPDLALGLHKGLQSRGVKVFTSSALQKSEKTASGTRLFLPDQTIEAEKVLVSVGRRLETEGLGLEKAGLTLEPNGSIKTDRHLKTAVDNIYAAGDITGKMLLAHLAARQGLVAAENIAGKNTLIDYRCVPSVVFSSPEIASVGLSLEEALTENPKAKSLKYPASALGLSIALKETEGFVKLVYDGENKTILGAHLLGKEAGSMISEMALAMSAGLKLDALEKTIHPHPTKSELFSEIAFLAAGFPWHFPPIKTNSRL